MGAELDILANEAAAMMGRLAGKELVKDSDEAFRIVGEWLLNRPFKIEKASLTP